MTPSPVRRIVLRTGKTCLKVLRALASPSRLHRAPRVLPTCVGTAAAVAAAPQGKDARKAVLSSLPLDDVVDLEDLQNRLNEAVERKLCCAA